MRALHHTTQDKKFIKAFIKFLWEKEEAYKRGEIKREKGDLGFTEKELDYLFLIPYNKKLEQQHK